MEMINIWKTVVLQRYAKFDGRAGRAEFWWFYLANLIIAIGLAILMGIGFAIATGLGVILAIVLVGYWLALIVPTIALVIRRLHDSNKSGWWILIGLIPFGGIVLLVFYILEGTPGPNDHGAATEPAVA